MPTLAQIKETITAKALWPQILSAYPKLHEALSHIGKHVTCPFHGTSNPDGKGDGFRLLDDINSSTPKNSTVAICNTCGSFTGTNLILALEGKDKPDKIIIDRLAAVAGMQVDALPVVKQAPSKYLEFMQGISPEHNQPVLKYLKSRGLSGDHVCLLSHSSPALVGLISDLEGSTQGIQTVRLDKTGNKKFKGIMKGADTVSGCSIHFGEPENVLFIGEGFETSIRIADVTEQATWCAVSAPLMGSMEVPGHVKTVVVLADKDRNGRGQNAAVTLADRLTSQGKTVHIVLPDAPIPEGAKSVDWLDVEPEALLHAVQNLPEPHALPAPTKEKTIKGTCFRKNPLPLSVPNGEFIAIEDACRLLNCVFVHIVHEGKNYVARTSKDSTGRNKAEFFKLDEFKNLFLNWPKVVVGTNKDGTPKLSNVGKAWLEYKGKNCSYEGVTFHPSDCDFYQGRMNTYYGFGVDPIACQEKELGLWLGHVLNVICSGEAELYEYLINWCAHMIQRPEEKPEVAVIMRAGQGAGKGTFVDPLGQIIGSHYVYADSPEMLSGRFNGALENKILVFADEAFFGSKAATDRMKSKITERYCTIERKGIDSVTVPDFSRIIMASNKDNVVRIEEDERRYLFLDVSEARKQDLAYFKPLQKQIRSGWLAPQLLHFLMSRDISEFEPRKVPKTKALMEQKIDHLEPAEAWVYHLLEDGRVMVGDDHIWPARMPVKMIQGRFEGWREAGRHKVFGDHNTKLGKALAKASITKHRIRTEAGRDYEYRFPVLDDCKAAFSKALGGVIDW